MQTVNYEASIRMEESGDNSASDNEWSIILKKKTHKKNVKACRHHASKKGAYSDSEATF